MVLEAEVLLVPVMGSGTFDVDDFVRLIDAVNDPVLVGQSVGVTSFVLFRKQSTGQDFLRLICRLILYRATGLFTLSIPSGL
jgi:hypothetical protein